MGEQQSLVGLLPLRVVYALRASDIYFLDELELVEDKVLLRIPNIGPVALKKIREVTDKENNGKR